MSGKIAHPTLHTALIAVVEGALNRALALDPAAPLLLAPLTGKVFEIQVTEPPLNVFATIGTSAIHLSAFCDDPAHTALKGRARDFVALATAADPAAALINGNIELHGDGSALLTLHQVLKKLEPDWEAPLTQLFGNVVGHQLGTALRGAARWVKSATASWHRQVDDYLREESDLFPHRVEVEDFYRAVEDLQQRSERIAAQLQRLTSASKPSPMQHQRDA